VGCVRRFECMDFVVGEVQGQCCDRLRQVMGLVAPTMGAETTGCCSTQAKATWAMLAPRAWAMRWTALTTGSSSGESKALTILSTLERWGCSPQRRARRPLPCGE